MSQILSYSTNSNDVSLLQQLDQYLPNLMLKQKAALAVVAMFEATEPQNIWLNYELEGLSNFTDCVELTMQLSHQGKLAVARALAEELAVLTQLGGVK